MSISPGAWIIKDGVRTGTIYAWRHQADAVLDQATPVQNTWYTVLAATDDVKLIYVMDDIETTGETLECEITIDGLTLTVSHAAVAGTYYNIFKTLQAQNLSALSLGTASISSAYQIALEGQSVAIRVRKTTANGTGNLVARITWAKLLPT